MGSANPLKDQTYYSLRNKLLPWTLYALLPIAIIHLYFYPIPLSLFPTDQPSSNIPIIVTSSLPSSSSSSPPPKQEKTTSRLKISCDYANGKWVHDKMGPLYNSTTCGTIKEGQNCMGHGRPDMGYLYYTWKPKKCHLPRFNPITFLKLMSNKHLAFIGDSMARNQLESLLCMLSTAYTPTLVYTNGEENKFRKWHFRPHNFTISIYWSPFLVKGVEKSNDVNYNRLYLDSIDERWGSEMDQMDMVVLSVGHWFLHPAVYYYGDSLLGCHFCPGLNYTEIGFFDVFGKAIKTTLRGITEKRGDSEKGIDVILTTFSPAHFEGEWDKFGACSKTEPYKEGEKKLEGMDFDMRKVEVEELEIAKRNVGENSNLRIEALDVTKLALMRGDGHPGPYMYPFPFANGISDRVQNDCVHWCLPGPVDTWNEILLAVMKRWASQSRRGR